MEKWITGRVVGYLRSNCENLRTDFELSFFPRLNGAMLKDLSVKTLSSFFVDDSQISGLDLYYKIHPTKVSTPSCN